MLKHLLTSLQNLIMREQIAIYTDGSHKGAWGSWAFVVVKNNKIIHEASGRERKAGSNRMEFHAALKALNYLPDQTSAQIFTDSRILIQAMTGIKQPAAHRDQIFNLLNLAQAKKISWHWVKAHSGVTYNERCDELCTEARKAALAHIHITSKALK